MGQTKSGEESSRFTNIPLDEVEPITPIRNMGRANIFASWDEILNPDWNQSPQRNLKGQRTNVDVVVLTRTRMKVTPVAADADAIGKISGLIRPSSLLSDMHLRYYGVTLECMVLWLIRRQFR